MDWKLKLKEQLEDGKLYSINFIGEIRDMGIEEDLNIEGVMRFFKNRKIEYLDINEYRIMVNYDKYMITCQ